MSRHHRGHATPLRRLAAQVRAEEPNCGRCGQPWNPNAHWNQPDAFSLGHIIPVSQAPHLKLTRSKQAANASVAWQGKGALAVKRTLKR